MTAVADRRAPERAANASPEMTAMRERALSWLKGMSAGAPGEYRLNRAAAPSPFASCFAAFLRHLLNDLDTMSSADRGRWLERMLGYQDAETGLFVDPENDVRTPDALHDPAHLNLQLTTFCLGAVHALGGSPRYRLAFLDRWSPQEITRWLDGLDWDEPWNAGNRAMFIGICLAYEAERTGAAALTESLDAWFAWHDTHQNPETGFWGRGLRANFIDGLGGAYHQFTVYNYVGRPIRYADRIVDRTLMVQSQDGMYWPGLGGATCYELDAVDVLVHMYARHDYRRADIRAALARLVPGVLSMQNPDGGFCWGRLRPFGVAQFARVVGDFLRHRSIGYLYLSLRWAVAARVKGRPPLRTGWADATRLVDESSIFDTWFRLVTIAEASTILRDLPFTSYPWQFLPVPGLGWFSVTSPGSGDSSI